MGASWALSDSDEDSRVNKLTQKRLRVKSLVILFLIGRGLNQTPVRKVTVDH